VNSARLYFNPTLSLYGVELPFSFVLSTTERSFNQPFNQFGVSPRYEWLTLHGGYRSMFVSEYTLSDAVILGGGAEVDGEWFHLRGMCGRFRRSVDEEIDGGVRVHWFPDTTQYLSGYYIFRGEGYGMPLKLITPLLPVTPGVYVDTSVGLQGGRTYMYAVQAVNTSHRASSVSDTAGAMPKIPILVDAPVGLEAVREGQLVRLSWNTVLPRHKDILGYRVYRRGPHDKAFLAVADTLQNPRRNTIPPETCVQ
jgi:hypothetical protein